MILFKSYHVQPILSRVKRQTRRTWAKARVRVGSVHWAQTSFRPSSRFARIRITGLRRERLEDMSLHDAHLEGYGTISEYRAVYEAIYGQFDIDEQVWVVDFEVETEGAGR